MQSKLQVFGYGSLINEESLRKTCPDATDLRPAFIGGFERRFSLWDEQGLTDKSHGELQSRPYCALDLHRSEGKVVNGVVFSITESLGDLKDREHSYQLVTVEARDYFDDSSLGDAVVCVAESSSGVFDSANLATMHYLNICLDGARSIGQGFYDEFCRTTIAGDQTLEDFLHS